MKFLWFGQVLGKLLTPAHRLCLVPPVRRVPSRKMGSVGWDGSSVEIISGRDEKSRPLALVEFPLCTPVKLGSPNDEVFDGHPLYGRGMDDYTAQRVRN